MIGYKDLVQYLKEQVGGNLKSYTVQSNFLILILALPIVNGIRKMDFIAS